MRNRKLKIYKVSTKGNTMTLFMVDYLKNKYKKKIILENFSKGLSLIKTIQYQNSFNGIIEDAEELIGWTTNTNTINRY